MIGFITWRTSIRFCLPQLTHTDTHTVVYSSSLVSVWSQGEISGRRQGLGRRAMQ